MCTPAWLERIGAVLERLQALDQSARPPRALLESLRVAWGNEPFAADLDLLDAVCELASGAQGPILECGCGLTSVALAVTAGRRGGEIWCLEYAAEWIERLARLIRAAGLRGIHLCHAPMRQYQGFAWYDPPLVELPAELSLVICDGPNGLHPLARPAKDPLARYGLMPVLGDRLARGALVVLDDVHRDGEREVLRRWLDEGDFDHDVRPSTKGAFALIRRATSEGQCRHALAHGRTPDVCEEGPLAHGVPRPSP